jgi:two-component system, chemotaxis family, sensor kinase CheA
MSDEPADFIASFIEDYFAESEEHLTAVRRGLLMLEPAIGGNGPATPVVEELFRSFHSLKGLSAMVELREAERLAHEMETCLGSIRDGQFLLSSEGFEALIDGANVLEQVIAARRARSPIPAVEEQIARLAAAGRIGRVVTARAPSTSPGDVPATPAVARWKITFTPSPDLVARGIKIDTIRGRLGDVGRIEGVAPRVTPDAGISFEFLMAGVDEKVLQGWRDDGITYEALPVTAETVSQSSSNAAASTSSPRAVEPAPALANFVRVDLARLDDLMRLLGDLVVTRARLEDTLARVEQFVPGGEWRRLQEETESIERQLRELRQSVMRVRLVPVAEIFRRMPFVVRDLARDNGKRVQLDLAGQSTEIDKFLIERMMDPVLHLVRNAISHGIELPQERIAAGKGPEGTIRLAASTVGESVMLEVSDDGRGMNVETIVSRARAAGVNVGEGDLDSRLLLDVICAPGFSTRDEIDRASGRGVGMAVVRDTVQDLGGTLSVETTAGAGTTFRAVLPLTLAITDALVVHVGDRAFAIPQSSVREVTEVETGALRAIENNELMTYRGTTLPVVRLARLFALEAAARPRMHVIVIGSGLAAVGLLVDRISGQREIVVKTLQDPLVKVPGVSGATELGDGRLVLMVDVAALTRKLRVRGMPMRAAI